MINGFSTESENSAPASKRNPIHSCLWQRDREKKQNWPERGSGWRMCYMYEVKRPQTGAGGVITSPYFLTFSSMSGLPPFSIPSPRYHAPARPGTACCRAATASSHLLLAVPLKRWPQTVDTVFSWPAANRANGKTHMAKKDAGKSRRKILFFLNYFCYYYFPA